MAYADPALDLTGCDREPIHIPGSIQPHGLLITVRTDDFVIQQVAGDTDGIIGRTKAGLLGEEVEAAVGSSAAALVRRCADMDLPEPLFIGSIASPADDRALLDMTAHARDGVLVIELEPSSLQTETAAQMLSRVRRIGSELEAASDLDQVLQAACCEVRRTTGFARVMIYRFLEDGAGCVAAEDKRSDLETFLNHHYPASDIPKQARALYLRNLIRVIPDACYTPAPVVPALNPVTNEPLDMSDCALRSVSPIHLQYLKNMGVVASMSVSIVVDGVLWGLISCHDTSARLVPYEQREACKHLAQILGQQIKAREDTEVSRQAASLASAREDLLGVLSQSGSVEQALLEHVRDIRGLLPADGAAVVVRGQVSRAGHAPGEAQVRELAEWLLRSPDSGTCATNSLPREHGSAAAYAAEASGLLATLVSRSESILLMWFRAEYIETVNWAGNPHKPVEAGSGPGDLTPRKSFEVWTETVRQRSRSWSVAENHAARKFGRAVLELVQQDRMGELNIQLRRTLADKEALLAQKDLLMQEAHHRVQNSLQLVTSMLHFQARQTSDDDVKSHFDEASRRIQAISAVHRRLWRRSDHIQSIDFGAYLEELRDDLLETWGSGWAGYIKIRARQLFIPTDTAVILALVVTELLTNAVKYAYEGKPGPIDVTMSEEGGKAIRLTVQDRGVGIGVSSPKSGLGSRLTRALVDQLRGEIEIAPQSPGTSVSVTVPRS